MKSGPDTTIPAVIAGLAQNGLGVVRSLAPAGISCWVLYDYENDPCLATRLATGIKIDDSGIDSLCTGLEAVVAATGQRPVLYLTNDEMVEEVSAAHARIEPLARMTMPNHSIVRRLLDKTECRALFDAADIRQPRSIRITSTDTIDELGSLRLPCIIKAGVKPRGYLDSFSKAYVIDNQDEARTIIEQLLRSVDGVIAQEWIEGSDTDIYFVLGEFGDGGKPLAMFSGQKLASYPPKFGTTAACIPARIDMSAMEDDTRRFFEMTGFKGLGGLEFKRHQATGDHFVIEPTILRTDFQSEIAPLNGINIPLAHYCAETGQPIPETMPMPRTGWYDPLSLAKLSRQTRRRIRRDSSGVRMRNAYWSWRDPMPYLVLHGRRLHGIGRRFIDLFRRAGTNG